MKQVLEIDGDRFDDYAGFAREFSTLLRDHEWKGSLDAFDDILYGGFGTPDGDFVLRWLNSAKSRRALGWPQTVLHLEQKLARAHPKNRDHVRAEIEAATRREGKTLFDIIVGIISDHGRHSGIDLELR